MDHSLETFTGEQRSHRRPVGEGPLDEAKIALPRQAGQTGVLEANVVRIVEVVDADDDAAAAKRRPMNRPPERADPIPDAPDYRPHPGLAGLPTPSRTRRITL
jgi:hypothetical protein